MAKFLKTLPLIVVIGNFQSLVDFRRNPTQNHSDAALHLMTGQ